MLKNIRIFKSLSIGIIFWITTLEIASDNLQLSVQTSSGLVAGTKGSKIILFEDIPYAEPPVSELRWQPPQPIENPRKSIEPKESNHCYQETDSLQDIQNFGTEDCLYLDIRVPQSQNKNLPVMFWIHGGGNTSGTKDFYDFSRLVAKKEVIVVSINYRLGIFGFFTHSAIQTAGVEPSNFGILDIIEALKWVQKNIKNFGGDPENVTIFGESAGGHNVYALLVSKQAKGLFHKAISQSVYTESSSLQNAYKPDEINRKDSADSWSVFNRLLVQKGISISIEDADRLQSKLSLEEQKKLLLESTSADLLQLYENTIEEPLLTNDGVVIPEDGLLAALGKPEHLNKVPVLAGSNRDEVKLWIGTSEYFLETKFSPLGRILNIPSLVIKNKDIYSFYNKIRAEGWQRRGVIEPLEQIFNTGNNNLYAYRFDWDDERNLFIADFQSIIGASHALEIAFISGDFKFLGKYSPLIYPRSPSRNFTSRNMMNFWTNFAKTGNPGTSTNEIEWTRYNPNNEKNFMILDKRKDMELKAIDINMPDIVASIYNSNLLKLEEKCILLYETTTYLGSDSFQTYLTDPLSGFCSVSKAREISEANRGYYEY